MRTIITLIVVFLLLCNCNKNQLNDNKIILIDSLAIENHRIDKLPEIFKSTQLFLDKEKLQIIGRDTVDGQVWIRNFSHLLSHILNLKTLNDSLLFIDGIPNFIVLNLRDGEYDVIFKDMDMTSNPILSNGNLYISGINLEIDTPRFALNILDYYEQQIIPTNICKIEPKMEVEDYLLTGHLIQTKNRLIFIFDWLGEYYLFDKANEQILKNDFLPLMGDSEKFEDDGTKPAYYQAYSATTYKDSLIFILREVDFETVDSDSPSEKSVISTLRKRIHVFNENMDLENSFLLPNKATQIKIIGNKLYTLHHKDNKIYIYEIHI